jgi:hypothetical protein
MYVCADSMCAMLVQGFFLIKSTILCVYVCMYVCMHACMHACMYVCILGMNIRHVCVCASGICTQIVCVLCICKVSSSLRVPCLHGVDINVSVRRHMYVCMCAMHMQGFFLIKSVIPPLYEYQAYVCWHMYALAQML